MSRYKINYYCTSLLLVSVLLTGCYTSSVVNPSAASDNMALGLAYFKEGDRVRAQQKLLLAEQQAPQDPLVQDTLGYFYEQSGELNKAEQYYQRALRIAPHDGAVQNNYATFLCRQKDYQLALKHFLLATQDHHYLHPAEAYENAGRCAARIPNKMLAIGFLQQALAHDPQARLGYF